MRRTEMIEHVGTFKDKLPPVMLAAIQASLLIYDWKNGDTPPSNLVAISENRDPLVLEHIEGEFTSFIQSERCNGLTRAEVVLLTAVTPWEGHDHAANFLAIWRNSGDARVISVSIRFEIVRDGEDEVVDFTEITAAPVAVGEPVTALLRRMGLEQSAADTEEYLETLARAKAATEIDSVMAEIEKLLGEVDQ